jgi:hypothetical protein
MISLVVSDVGQWNFRFSLLQRGGRHGCGVRLCNYGIYQELVKIVRAEKDFSMKSIAEFKSNSVEVEVELANLALFNYSNFPTVIIDD